MSPDPLRILALQFFFVSLAKGLLILVFSEKKTTLVYYFLLFSYYLLHLFLL